MNQTKPVFIKQIKNPRKVFQGHHSLCSNRIALLLRKQIQCTLLVFVSQTYSVFQTYPLPVHCTAQMLTFKRNEHRGNTRSGGRRLTLLKLLISVVLFLTFRHSLKQDSHKALFGAEKSLSKTIPVNKKEFFSFLNSQL